MTESVCKSLRFNTMPAITTRFGRKRGTLECGLHDVACVAGVIGEGEERGGVREARKIRGIGERGKGTPAARTSLRKVFPLPLSFFRFPRSPSLSPMYSASHCSFESKWHRL